MASVMSYTSPGMIRCTDTGKHVIWVRDIDTDISTGRYGDRDTYPDEDTEKRSFHPEKMKKLHS